MDNIDKTIKPNDMRMDYQTQSLHYVHKYAVADRIDLSTFDDKPCRPEIGKIRLDKMLPTKEDGEAIQQNMAFLVAQVLIKNIPFLKPFARSLGRHILHPLSQEMSHKSEVVSIWRMFVHTVPMCGDSLECVQCIVYMYLLI